jgi:hypothetical protein
MGSHPRKSLEWYAKTVERGGSSTLAKRSPFLQYFAALAIHPLSTAVTPLPWEM